MAALLLLGAGGFRVVGPWLAVMLLKADHIRNDDWNGVYSNQSLGHDKISSKLDGWLDRNGITKKLVFGYLGLGNVNGGLPYAEHLLACSRPATRLRFARAVMADARTTNALATDGARLFAAVTGADVDCSVRRRLAADLKAVLDGKRAAEESRAMAAMWLGMVFLSDPEEFARWRTAARDAMLACDDPPLSPFGDQWLRVADCLLAYDPPESWGTRAKGFARHPDLLKRAVRERVRGTLAELDAIRSETDRLERDGAMSAAFALWLDAGRWQTAWPESPWQRDATEWRQKILVRWLLDERMEQSDSASAVHSGILARLPADAVMELPERDREAVFRRAVGLAEKAAAATAPDADKETREFAHQRVALASSLLPFLDPVQRREVVRLAANVWLRRDIVSTGASDDSRYYWCDWCRNKLCRHADMLDETQRQAAAREFRISWERTGNTHINRHMAPVFDERAILNDIEWLLTALASRLGYWDRVEEMTPGLRAETQDKLARAMAAGVTAMHRVKAEGGDAREAFLAGLRTCNDGKPFPEVLETWCWHQAHFGYFRQTEQDTASQWVRTRMADVRLLESGNESPGVTRSAGARAWRDAASARIALLDGLDHPDLDYHKLLDAAEKEPPTAEVVAAAWEVLLHASRSGAKQRRLAAFGGLFRLAPLLDASSRLAMRGEFLRFFRWQMVPLADWPGWMLESAVTPDSARGGDGIPWEDDDLSAAMSWWSQIGSETYPRRQKDAARADTGVFSYVANAYLEYEAMSGLRGAHGLDAVVPEKAWVRLPLRAPFEATPWQRARSLHLRRPDLCFPDRALYRP